jgi:hypothetical protein
MTSDIFTQQRDFWQSLQHEQWMLSLNTGDESDYRPVAVEIDGIVIPYTTCRVAGADEPFDGALKNFPDYVKVATGTLHGWRYRKGPAK